MLTMLPLLHVFSLQDARLKDSESRRETESEMVKRLQDERHEAEKALQKASAEW